MKTIKRRWLILQNIPRHGFSITAEELVNRLTESLIDEDITLRTVQRDLLELCDNLPIEYGINGRKHCYSWRKGHQLMVPGMDYHSAFAFTLLKERMSALLPKPSLAYLDPFFRNARETLAAHPEHFLPRWKEKVRIVSRGMEMNPPRFKTGAVETVYDALFKDRRISASYRKRGSSGIKEYKELNPLGLVFVDNLIYLIVSIGDYLNPVQFLLHRMESVTILDKNAVIPDGFTLQGYIESGEFSYPVSSETFRLQAVFERDAAAYLHETPLPGTIGLADFDDDHVLLEADVQDNRQLRFWLRGFGDGVEILGPPELREEFREMANNLSEIYD